jgi:hypothetical protein
MTITSVILWWLLGLDVVLLAFLSCFSIVMICMAVGKCR